MDAKRFLIFALLAGLFLSSAPLLAHHSNAEYDMGKTSSVKGTVTLFEWVNPHPYIYIDVKNDKGEIEKWTGELQALPLLARAGWRRDTLKSGDEITAIGNPSKDGKPLMHLSKIVFANGQELPTAL